MADDTNIDEILKSIDALLKDGGLESHSDKGAAAQSSKTHGDIATNDDEVLDSEIPDASVPVENEEDEADASAEEPIDQEAEEHPQAEEAEMDEQPEVDRETEDALVAGSSEIDALSEDAFEQGHEVKRIVLSESMVVEDTPGLPLESAGIQTAIEEDLSGNRAHGEIFSDESNPDHITVDDFSEGEAESYAESPESEDLGSPTEVPENEQNDNPSVDTSELDVNKLVEQITSEISVRLQQQLPGMVAGMVAEAMQKNLAAHVANDNESTDDTQN